jgi:NTP pyrophosphatase (non-canonical NTP hydrolase)
MKDLQRKVKEFCQENSMVSPAEINVLDLVTEVGEVAKEVIKMSNYGRSTWEYREEVKSELGDVLFSLMVLANTLNVDLDDELQRVLEKYYKRLQKGSPGSESE